MTRRYTGGFLSATEQVTDANTANGIFSVQDAAALTAAGSFPTGRWTPQRSLRFRASVAAYLNRTFGTPTNNKVWTWSAWVKRGSLTLADANHLFLASPTDVGGNPSTYTRLVFETDGTLRLQSNASASEAFTSSALFRDPAAWYHIVLSMDAVNTTVRCFVNGKEITYASRTQPTNANTAINGSGNYHRMGLFRSAELRPFDGYMADVNFVDGQALDPSQFGTTDPQTGTWVPKRYSGTYGNNGFYLDFRDNTAATATTLGADRSGNGNNWTPNNFTVSGTTSTILSYTSVGTTTWTPPANVSSVRYLVVAGGGAGGSAGPTMYDGGAGGGGAGGMLTGTMAVTPGTVYSIYVGAGASGAANRNRGASGDNSVFSSSSTSITAIGGGGGGGGAYGAGLNTSGANGGSGGGGANGGAAGTGTAGQGNNGGYYVGSPGNGGGGAGGVGGSATNNVGANGGLGLTSDISGSSVTYAGGGGGGGYQLGGGTGGSSVGGNGGANNSNGGSASTAGSGGGGSGGTYNTSGTLTGGSGANGTIILSYSVPDSTYDSSVDVPGIAAVSSQTDFGGVVRGNYATLNSIDIGYSGVLSEGNLKVSTASAANVVVASTMALTTNTYCEVTIGSNLQIGLLWGTARLGYDSSALSMMASSGGSSGVNVTRNISATPAWTNGETLGFAWNPLEKTLTLYQAGVATAVMTMLSSPAGDPLFAISNYTSGAVMSGFVNFGQRPFRYAPPTGYKSLNTTNLPNPIIKRPSDHFDVKTYTGNGTALTVGNTQKQTSAYAINKSLRFKGESSAYLSRTFPTAGNRQTWTWSGWVKRSHFGINNYLFSGGTGGGDTTQNGLKFETDDTLVWTGAATMYRRTTQLFRSSSTWYHIVMIFDTTQSVALDRIRFYVNGSQITSFSTIATPTQNLDYGINQAAAHNIGRWTGGSNPLYGYLAEVNFIDGQARTPASFGAFDANNNWVPQRYTGTYGTNGYYLPFNDPTSTTTIGYDRQLGLTDSSKNNWTSNSISVTAGATYDSMFDSPTDTVDSSGNIVGNHCILDPTFKGSTYIPTISNAALTAQAEYGSQNPAIGTLTVTSGKWYYEVYIDNQAYSPNIGWIEKGNLGTGDNYRSLNNAILMNTFSGTGYVTVTSSNGSSSTNLSQISSASYAWATGNTVMVALDADAKKVWFGKNGTWLTNSGVGNPGTGEFPTATYPWNLPMTALFDGSNVSGNKDKLTYNFGQRAFTYTPPTGFRSLNTKNLKDVGSFNLPDTFGNFVNSPDLIWTKSRTQATSLYVYDTIRGPGSRMVTNSNVVPSLIDGVTSFNPYGFTVGAETGNNNAGDTYVGWSWNKGKIPGFDTVTYTGNGTNGQDAMKPHNLGQVPAFYVTKNLSGNNNANGFLDWNVWHKSVDISSYGGNKTMYLQSDTNAGAAGGYFINPTSTHFSPNQINYDNSTGHTYIAYLWAEVPGFSKMGSWAGNSSTDGPFIYTGFRPRWIMTKRYTSTGNWLIMDTARNQFNDTTATLNTLASAESPGAGGNWGFDILSNGFKIRGLNSEINTSGQSYIYVAFAETPFKYANAR